MREKTAAQRRRSLKDHKKAAWLPGFIIPTLVCLFNVFLIAYPQEVLSAAREGLGLWFNNVLPSLLPFIIATNILTGMGFVRFLGTLLSPVMVPLFHAPGAGGFALITGLTSGYPMGAKVVAQLRTDKQLTQEEAQRLIGFCNNAGPLFIIGVAGTGLFGSTAAGYCLWLSHVTAALATGLLFRFYRYNRRGRASVRTALPGAVLMQALNDYQIYRRENDCAFGRVLGDSVKNAMESVTIIGGFIIFFCVMVRVLAATGLTGTMRAIFISGGFSETAALFDGMIAGLLEVTNGVKWLAPSAAGNISHARLIMAAAIISFGGFSIHAQTMHFIRHTDIKMGGYLLAKVLHAVLAAGLCACFIPYFEKAMTPAIPAMRLWENSWSFSWLPMIVVCAALYIIGPALLLMTARRSK